ncbi:MAG: hypothetical protein R2802_00435 [Flavobacteriaceae bacterium]
MVILFPILNSNPQPVLSGSEATAIALAGSGKTGSLNTSRSTFVNSNKLGVFQKD